MKTLLLLTMLLYSSIGWSKTMGPESKDLALSCLSIAIERSLMQARKIYPSYMAMVPVSANYEGIDDEDGIINNRYEVKIQVTTKDDYREDLSFVHKFPNKKCLR